MRKESQSKVLPHSQAKLDLFQKYLWKYLMILGLAKGIKQINIYDIFCGTGIYEDGKEGSPIIAFNLIKRNREVFENNNWEEKEIVHLINDAKLQNVEKIYEYLTTELATRKINCRFRLFNLDAEKMFGQIIREINSQSKFIRNLVFIDPYGYKNIHKDQIENILANGRTEIFLFLPVSFMQRFKNIALESDQKCYEHLQKFLNDFFPKDHPIRQPEDILTLDFIEYIEEAFSFNEKYFSVSHSIERSKNNFFAVFFITSHVLGLEKMIQTKWEQDKDYGKGFRIKSDEPSLFDDFEKEQIHDENLDRLTKKLLGLLDTKPFISNVDLYIFVLKEGYLVKHLNIVLKELRRLGKFKIWDASKKNQLEKVRSFYIGFKYYKTDEPKLFIQKG